jgi:hypothetical protein
MIKTLHPSDLTHTSIKPYLKAQLSLHPAMTPQDVAKLCYQAAHGAEHLLADLSRARGYLLRELESVEADPHVPLIEPISDEIARVNLAAWKARELSADQLFDLFAATAQISEDGGDRLQAYLDEAEALLSDEQTAISPSAWSEFRTAYDALGRPSIHHSDSYRSAEHPAYRIVRRALLGEIMKFIQEK